MSKTWNTLERDEELNLYKERNNITYLVAKYFNLLTGHGSEPKLPYLSRWNRK